MPAAQLHWTPGAEQYQRESCDRTAWYASAERSNAYDQPPKLRTQTRPVYPQEAFDARVQGTVDVEILIDPLGNVIAACVVKSPQGLAEAAATCVRQWKFTPAQKDGKPVSTLARAPVTFRIF